MSYADALVGLEERIRALPGVVGVVIASDGAGAVGELQVFTAAGTSERQLHDPLRTILHDAGVEPSSIFVFELATEAPDGEPVVFDLRQAATPPSPEAVNGTGPAPEPRLAVRRVHLRSDGPTSEARVSLGRGGEDRAGDASAPATSFNLGLVADATLAALDAFLDRPRAFELVGSALVEVLGRTLVCVVLRRVGEPAVELVGACAVGDRSVHESAVRATLDAVNRQLTLGDI